MSGAFLFLSLFAICNLQSTMSFASSPGTTTGELLKIPVSARAVGMGEAYVAAADDSAALAWNPAGMSFAHQNEASFMHSSLIEGVHYEHLAFMSPGDNYSYGVSMGYLGFGDIAGFDDTGKSIGNQTASSYMLSGGASAIVMDHLSLGFAGSVLREALANESANTFAVNLGALYALAAHPLGAEYRFGASALNLGPGLKFVTDRDPLPAKYKLGAAILHIKEIPLNLTADFTIPNDNDKYISLGSEYWFRDLIALRLGYIGSNDQGKGVRVGLGLKLREFVFDYAYGGFGDFGATHRIEIALKWGEKVRQLNREQRSILKEAQRAGDGGDYPEEIMRMNELLEKDPTNDRILKHMIGAHEHMLKKELKDAVADTDIKRDSPTAEEFALQDLVPAQATVAQASPIGFDPLDPLGLNKLPDANILGTVTVPAPSPSPAVVPSPSAPAGVDTMLPGAAPAAASTHSAPDGDGVLLNPADIFGN